MPTFAHRLGEKAAPATVKNELAQLKRSMNLAHRGGRLTVKPAFPLIRTDNARRGFVTEEQMRAILRELPAYLRPLGLFGWYAGWRSTEVSGLMWKNVDMANGVIRLEAEQSKNRRARVFPFRAIPELVTMMRERRERTRALEKAIGAIVSWVFWRGYGTPIRSFWSAWTAACRRAGLPGIKFHDLRRSAAREMSRAGVPERVIMDLCGW
jgi:integrase